MPGPVCPGYMAATAKCYNRYERPGWEGTSFEYTQFVVFEVFLILNEMGNVRET